MNLEEEETFGGTPMAANRVQRPGMLNVEDLSPGLVIRYYHRDRMFLRYRILSVPTSQTVNVVTTSTGVRETLYLCDMGMVPYPPGVSWNATNYVTRDPNQD
jgi:hypothetical protein